MLIRSVQRLDALFGRPMPYQLWVPQTEFGHLSVTIGGLLCGRTVCASSARRSWPRAFTSARSPLTA